MSTLQTRNIKHDAATATAIALSSDGGVAFPGAVSATAPASPADGQIWIDTSGASPVAKFYDATGAAWQSFSDGVKATVSGTTGSPTVDTTSVPGKTLYKFTGAGSITFATSGYVRALVCGAGGGGGTANSVVTSSGAGGGGGGQVSDANVYVTAGIAYSIVIGSGGTAPAPSNPLTNSSNGSASYFGPIMSVGGGAGGHANSGAGLLPTGGNRGGEGGVGSGTGAEGGDGTNGAGASQSSGNGGNGGTGVTSDITGTSIVYGAGGGGGAGSGGSTGGTSGSGGNGGNKGSGGTAGTANRGGGGGGAGYGANSGGSGGSGYVVLAVG